MFASPSEAPAMFQFCIGFPCGSVLNKPPPRPAKIVEPNTASSSGAFEQYTLLDWLVDAEKHPKQSDDAMVIDEPAKTVADLSKHPDDMDIIEGELIY